MNVFKRLIFDTYVRNEQGNILILTGLLLIPLIGIVGLAVDAARTFSVRSQLQQSLDAAALAGGRLFSEQNRNETIQAFFNENIKVDKYEATFSDLVITEDPVAGTLQVSATSEVPMIFAKVLGTNKITVAQSSQIVRNETTLEVGLVIDTTGSMSNNDNAGNYKMGAAKDAANLLLDILYNNKDSDEDVYVSVVPFVQNVNVGNSHSSWLEAGSQAAIPWNSGPFPSASGWRGCVVERLDSGGTPHYDTTEENPSRQAFVPYADSFFGPTCPNWSPNEKGIVPGICRTSDGKIYTATTSGTTGSNAPTATSGSVSDGAVSWVYWYNAYPTSPGYAPVSCPIWQANSSVTVGSCRFAPNCPNWASGETLTAGECRVSSGKIYTATTSGTTSGGSGPNHTIGSQTVGGITWSYRTASYPGVGGNIYYAYTGGTTGTNTPVHRFGIASDGAITWGLWERMWVSGEVLSSGDSRVNPWYFLYSSNSNNTTSGTMPPTHVSGTSTSGSIQWQYRGRLPAQVANLNSQYGYGYNSGCGTPISPLQNSRLVAKATVDALYPSIYYGGTMTPMGLIWGWRSISPQWRGWWQGVAAEHPYDYNAADNYKAVIIMTDGENVFNSCVGGFCRGSNTPYGYLPDGRLGTTVSASAVSQINSKVLEICQNIRASGTLLYAILFDLPSGASSTRTLFQNCVGDSSHFFDAVNADDLTAAFRTIAIDLSRLRLSK